MTISRCFMKGGVFLHLAIFGAKILEALFPSFMPRTQTVNHNRGMVFGILRNSNDSGKPCVNFVLPIRAGEREKAGWDPSCAFLLGEAYLLTPCIACINIARSTYVAELRQAAIRAPVMHGGQKIYVQTPTPNRSPSDSLVVRFQGRI